MRYIGIDIGKDMHAVATMNEAGELLRHNHDALTEMDRGALRGA